MDSPTDIVRDVYARLSAGDAPGALALLAADVEWISMWRYKVEGRGPGRVAEGLLKPLMADWSAFALVSDELIRDGDTVVSLGRFTGTHRISGKSANAAFAHVWTVRAGRIQRFRQYIDTLAVAVAEA